MLTDYQFDKLISDNTKKFTISKIDIVYENSIDFNAIYKKIEIISSSINIIRDLVNYPANIANIDFIENEVRKIAKKNSLEVKLFNEKELLKKGFNLIYSVGKAGNEEPRLIEVSYKSGNKQPNICIVGKGIVFDSGGLNLKPDTFMADMKQDMSGSAIVLGIIKIVSELKLNINLTILMPLAENAIDGNSMRPSDVVTAYNKKTVEILNTDAEGRLILADSLSYSDSKKCDLVIDIATLTGAAVVALGTKITAGFFRGDKYKNLLLESANNMNEPIWELPLYEDYKEMMKSSIADIANLGTPGRQAGTIMAALFLGEFIKNENWIHLDVAGPAFFDKECGYNPKGGTAVMIRTIVDFLTKISN
jgi:leucyl aminopeptidase